MILKGCYLHSHSIIIMIFRKPLQFNTMQKNYSNVRSKLYLRQDYLTLIFTLTIWPDCLMLFQVGLWLRANALILSGWVLTYFVSGWPSQPARCSNPFGMISSLSYFRCACSPADTVTPLGWALIFQINLVYCLTHSQHVFLNFSPDS